MKGRRVQRLFFWATVPALLLLASTALWSMPPLKPGPDPDYPPGVNAPARGEVIRDGADIEGEWNCLVILIDFDDYPWDNQEDENFPNQELYYTTGHFGEMLFSRGEFQHPGSESEYTGSMRDYYREVSAELFETVGQVTVWYRAPEPLSYYCNNDGEPGTGDDYGFGEYPNNVQRLVEDALELADEDIDFSRYDNDGEGNVDALFVAHSGPGAEEFGRGDEGAGYIWSHKWQIDAQERDGVVITAYSMEPENGSIGVYCHEFGHILGLPDLYDTDYSSEGIGEWCLMSGGGWCHRAGDPPGTCPSHMCGWSKMQLEWVEVINVVEFTADQIIQPVETNPVIYRLWTNGEDSPEYFLAEHRRRIGFDAGLTRRQIDNGLPAPEGLLITHIDDNQWSNDNERHRLVDVEEASPVFIDGEPFEHLDHGRTLGDDLNLFHANRGDNGDLWPGFSATGEDSTDWVGNRNRDAFSYNSEPSSTAYSGQPSLVSIWNICFDDHNIICNLDVTPPPYLPYVSDYSIDDSCQGNGNGYAEPGETVGLTVVIANSGRLPLTGLSGILTREDLLVEIISDSSSWNDIDPDSRQPSTEPFVIRILDGTPPVCEIEFLLLVREEHGFAGNLPFSIFIRPPHDWFKYPGNPVLSGEPGGWDEGFIFSPALVMEEDTLKCWYISDVSQEVMLAGSIGLAWSTDGGLTWERLDAPVLIPEEVEWITTGFSGIGVMNTGYDYAMMFTTPIAEDGSSVIGLARSEDGMAWEVSEGPVLTAEEGWMSSIFGFGQLSLFADGEEQAVCAFTGTDQQGMTVIVFAISMDLTGWQVLDDPRLMPTMGQDDFDAYVVLAPDVTGDSLFTMLYAGFGMDYVSRLGIAEIAEGNIIRQPGLETGGSVLEPGGEGSWGESWLFGGRLYEWQGQRRMLFTGTSEVNSAVGLALPEPILAAPPETGPTVILPRIITLYPAYPNPFNSAASINFQLAKSGLVSIAVFDISGRLVKRLASGEFSEGQHTLWWLGVTEGGIPAASGIYILKVSSLSVGEQQRMVLLR